jgi:hypothetical protein
MRTVLCLIDKVLLTKAEDRHPINETAHQLEK